MQLQKVEILKRRLNNDYPFNLEIIQNFTALEFNEPITLIVGENGSGKSSFIEALSIATNLPTIGAESSSRDKTLLPASELAKDMKLSWGIRNHRGFFMRAEDFFGFQKRVSESQRELREQKEEFSKKFTGYGKFLATSATESHLKNLEKKYGQDPDAFSHGESFINLFAGRLVPEGLYILDEPEVPLSPQRQLTLISMIKEQVNSGSQFIIATHSPILMALPESQIYEIKEGKFVKTKYDDLEHVNLMRDFLNDPKNFIRRL